MSPDPRNGDRETRRPLLGAGERLRGEAERTRFGRKTEPAWTSAEMYERLAPSAERLKSEFALLPEALRAQHVVIEATLWPNYLASSHYPDVLLNRFGLYAVGTKQGKADRRTTARYQPEQSTKTLLLAGSDEGIRGFVDLALTKPTSEEDPLWSQLREFTTFGLPSPEAIVHTPANFGDGELFTWEAVLSPVGRTDVERLAWGDIAFEKWVALVRSLHGDVDLKYRRFVGGLTFVPVSMTVESAKRAASFNLLRVMRPMPRLRSIPTELFKSSTQPPPSPPPLGTAPRSRLRIATFDGGVDLSLPALAPYVRQIDLTSESAIVDGVNHGTVVSTALLYGYVESGRTLPRPTAFLDHYRVLPPPAPPSGDFEETVNWLLDEIERTVRTHRYSIVNLSLGPECVVEDDGEPNRWTATLDALAAELGVVFVCAAGNNGEEDAASGRDRVQVPADMANGIGVGACVSRSLTVAPKRARYSARGPGRPGQRVSPAGVQFGGVLPKTPFVGVAVGGTMVETAGTSFAAPLVTHGVAGLAATLGSAYGQAHILRAFGAHFADRHPSQQRRRDVGHGRFKEDYAPVWECPADTVTLLYHDRLQRGEQVAMYLPVPEGIPADALVQIEWTLCYTSAVDPTDTADYTRSGIEVYFRPHYRRRSLFNTKTKKQILEVVDFEHDEAKIVEILRTQPAKWSDSPLADQGWQKRDEGSLRNAGKWETLSRGQRTFIAKDLFKPRIDLNHLARARGVLVNERIEPLPVALLVTVRVPGLNSLYDVVRQQIPVLVPLEQLVQLPVRLLA